MRGLQVSEKYGFRDVDLTAPWAFKQFMYHWKEISWWYFQFTNHIVSKYFLSYENKGIYIAEEDWDNLIILDDCRYDLFKERVKNSNISGILEKRESRGSSTPGFLIENFGRSKRFPDIVYVTANPFVQLFLDNRFFSMVNVWKDSWDEDVGTVHPREVMKAAFKAYDDYPHKKLIIHFMQPHSPFIGAYRIKSGSVQLTMMKQREKLMRAYSSNLDLVLVYVKSLLNKIKGKTVITSDHGEAFGERTTFLRIPIFGHPNGVYMPPLVEVPWLVINHSRRVIAEESATGKTNGDKEKACINSRSKFNGSHPVT